MSGHEFKVGDRVRVVADDCDTMYNGKLGTVSLRRSDPASTYSLEVMLDDHICPRPYGPNELEPIKARKKYATSRKKVIKHIEREIKDLIEISVYAQQSSHYDGGQVNAYRNILALLAEEAE